MYIDRFFEIKNWRFFVPSNLENRNIALLFWSNNSSNWISPDVITYELAILILSLGEKTSLVHHFLFNFTWSNLGE
jgi:hypothetical protein